MEGRRIEWIDVSKGIAIILVVIGHVVASYQASGQYLESTLMNLSHQYVYSFHMALFMFISGILYRNKGKKKKHICKIMLNYGVPYLTFSVVWWVFKQLLSSFANSQLTVLDLILVPVFPISFMWFIYALMIMEIVQVLIGHHTVKKVCIQICASLILLVIQYGCRDLKLMDSGYVFSDLIISDVMKLYTYFTLGVYFGKKVIKRIEGNLVAFEIGGYCAYIR